MSAKLSKQFAMEVLFVRTQTVAMFVLAMRAIRLMTTIPVMVSHL